LPFDVGKKEYLIANSDGVEKRHKKIMKYAIFNASFKLIIKKNNKILMLTESPSGCLDFPGGRLENNEIKNPLKDLFKREIREELGKDIKYKILGPAIQYRRYNKTTKMNVLVSAYEAEYLSGEIKLSDEHSKYEWINPKTYDLKGKKIKNKEEMLAFKNYFKIFPIYS
jgi:8-oxo-dGTP pyrophosphatase MutT (NUDIX family)